MEQAVPWSEVSEVGLGTSCTIAHTPPLYSQLEACKDNSIDVFLVKFRHLTEPVAVENVALTSAGLFHLDAFEPWEQAHGPRDEVQSVARRSLCRGQSLEFKSLPSTFCHEPRQVAVEFDYNHPFDNKILTNGFSFFTSVIGRPTQGF